jgi:hypothetical protein
VYEVGFPLHVPVEAVSAEPTVALPLIVGAVRLAGGPLVAVDDGTAAVAAEVAAVVPFAFEADTVTRIVEPPSADETLYVEAVALAIAAHAPPELSHRDHWKPYLRPFPSHVPASAERDEPT